MEAANRETGWNSVNSLQRVFNGNKNWPLKNETEIIPLSRGRPWGTHHLPRAIRAGLLESPQLIT